MRERINLFNCTVKNVNRFHISPELFSAAMGEIIQKFGWPLSSKTPKLEHLSAILFIENWAKFHFPNEAHANAVAVAVYARFSAYLDIVPDLFIGWKEDLSGGRFDWLNNAFIAAAATVPIHKIENIDDHYKAYFKPADFAAAVQQFAGFYRLLDGMPVARRFPV